MYDVANIHYEANATEYTFFPGVQLRVRNRMVHSQLIHYNLEECADKNRCVTINTSPSQNAAACELLRFDIAQLP